MTALPEGCRLQPLEPHDDARGRFTEVLREEWGVGVTPAQWNLVRSRPGVLRGVHVHVRHADYLVLAAGRATVGLSDLRPGHDRSPVAITLEGDDPVGLTIPPGVAHGFLFHEESIHVYAVSEVWDPADELGCRWDDPELGIPWPAIDPVLSDRDAGLPCLADLLEQLDRTGRA